VDCAGPPAARLLGGPPHAGRPASAPCSGGLHTSPQASLRAAIPAAPAGGTTRIHDDSDPGCRDDLSVAEPVSGFNWTRIDSD
jgi:hypothetical protein